MGPSFLELPNVRISQNRGAIRDPGDMGSIKRLHGSLWGGYEVMIYES